jgi:ribose 5-phosphate isomerase B
MRIGIATDHGRHGLKQELLVQFRAAGHEVVDFGAHSLMPDDGSRALMIIANTDRLLVFEMCHGSKSICHCC